MNKEESTKYLTEILTEHKGQKAIINPPYQKHLLETAIAWEECSQGDFYTRVTNLGSNGGTSAMITRRIYSDVLDSHEKSLAEKCEKVTEANYVFIETNDLISQSEDESNIRSTAIIKSYLTYFAIIGEKEIDFLKDRYKGDLSGKEKEAVQEIGIEKMLDVDYTKLLEENPNKFCDWFRDISDKKRIEIVNENWDLLNDKKLDNRIRDLLSADRYKSMILKIGRDKLTE